MQSSLPSIDSPLGHSLARRTFLGAAGLGGLAWLTPLAERLARAEEAAPAGAPARSVIVLWMQGGPSQLETFDPHPGAKISAGSRAIKTAVEGVSISEGLPLVAEQMESISLVRSVWSKEGDHERATYNGKTGYRPDPTLVHPAIGAVLCHQLTDNVEIPRHISILPNQWSARGGYLGDEYDAFRVYDPQGPIPDVARLVSQERYDRRMADLQNVVESEFARGRLRNLDQARTLHATSLEKARIMMSSDQLKAFDVKLAPESQRKAYGDTPFGRGCLAALRLIEVGVRCVEVTLDGWDTHANNHEFTKTRNAILDPAYAALLRDLKERKLHDSTIVLWGGEFGRTPRLNPLEGRDHWPHGFTMALSGGGLRGGVVVGETSPDPRALEKNQLEDVRDPHNVADIHATVLAALGIRYQKELRTPIGRPMAICEGKPISQLLDRS